MTSSRTKRVTHERRKFLNFASKTAISEVTPKHNQAQKTEKPITNFERNKNPSKLTGSNGIRIAKQFV